MCSWFSHIKAYHGVSREPARTVFFFGRAVCLCVFLFVFVCVCVCLCVIISAPN